MLGMVVVLEVPLDEVPLEVPLVVWAKESPADIGRSRISQAGGDNAPTGDNVEIVLS
ncbi:hypothetical protein NKH49_33180 [Mesorhizobium sp. M1088]|uniref:hypothetical protein n=1 Tax=Mesorhizobium sp. M1088 TaxID=2957056 RepID=UPI003334C41D